MTTKAISEIAEWLKDSGYPFDWGCEAAPPAALWDALVRSFMSEDTSLTYQDWEWAMREGMNYA